MPAGVLAGIGVAILLSISIPIIIAAVLGVMWLWQRWQRERHITKKEEYQARVISTEHGTWFIAHPNIDVVPLHSTPFLRINGHERDLTPDERFFTTLQAPHHKASDAVAMLPATIQQGTQQLDLLTIFTQPSQSYAIIAGQQVGKTFQARRIAQYWLQSGIQPVVIGPKWDTGEWVGCALFGGAYDFEAVGRGMVTIEAEARRRHADTNRAHREHPILPVFFDDWTAIRAQLKEAENFIDRKSVV